MRAVTISAHFSDLGLSAPLIGALAAEGCSTPTPIQSQAIALASSDDQVLVAPPYKVELVSRPSTQK
jgi:superfamily II DNA/RNA helicase